MSHDHWHGGRRRPKRRGPQKNQYRSAPHRGTRADAGSARKACAAGVMRVAYSGRPGSPSSQPRALAVIGSVGTCAPRISPHLVHRSVQCSNPERAAAMCWTSMRDWHLRQRGRAAARSEWVGLCRSGIDAALEQAGALPTLCHGTAEDGPVIAAVCRCRYRTRWSILLSLKKLMATRANNLWPDGLSHWTSHSALRSL
jgi:hypothetical protein